MSCETVVNEGGDVETHYVVQEKPDGTNDTPQGITYIEHETLNLSYHPDNGILFAGRDTF